MTETNSTPGRPSVGATLLRLITVVPFLAGFFGLYNLLGVGMPYIGLLFVLYWAAFQHQQPAVYFPSVLGGLSGLLLAWLLVCLPPLIGPAGAIVSLGVLAVTLFCFMRGQASLVVNNSTMLFVTVATISELKIAEPGTFVVMVESLLLAAAYMGAVWAIGQVITKHRSKKSVAAPPT